jgi:putative nucleotidyltransferase with HDIG domain
MACGIAAMAIHSADEASAAGRYGWQPRGVRGRRFAGGLGGARGAGDVHAGAHSQHLSQSIVFGLIVLGALIVLLVLNFVLFALERTSGKAVRSWRSVRELFLPLLPASSPWACSRRSSCSPTGASACRAARRDPGALIFRHLTVALVRSEDRADQLEARSPAGLLAAGGAERRSWRALALRDRRPLRHAAAVARYAKALAIELGCDEAEQEVIHTAGLLHDIGKFTWSDRVLHPESAHRRGLGVIRRHPQDGAIAGRQARRLRAGRRRDPLPPRAHRRRRLPGRADRQRDTAGLAHRRDLLAPTTR